MTLVGPILMASILLVPIFISKYSQDKTYRIQIIDQDPLIFRTVLPGSDLVQFINDTNKLEKAKQTFNPEKYDGILYVPADLIKNPGGVVLYMEKQVNLQVKSYVERVLQTEIENAKLKSNGINQQVLESIKTEIDLKTLTLKGQENNAELTTIVGFVAGLMIYLFIFLYGVQVMRGVIEEKTNRIVEVIISSVKPFQLMMGKIIGIALVGLTQFFLWIILTFTISSFIGSWSMNQKTDPHKIVQQMNDLQTKQNVQGKENTDTGQQKAAMDKLFDGMASINFPLIIGCFLFYFLGGYLLYSALFAAIGAAVDNETETQQFMLPVTIPLVISFIVAQSIVSNPESQLGFWFSIIPLTSPVVMMVRIAFGVPTWELILSMTLLVLGFIGTTWLAGRIYRTGILLYGKKVNLKELGRWLFYKE